MGKRILVAVLLLSPAVVDTPAASAGRSSSLPLLVAGHLEDDRGRPLRGSVDVFAWPPQAGAREGDVVELIPVAGDVTAPDGAFAVRAAASPTLLAAAAPTNGHLNLVVRATSEGRVERRFLTRLVPSDATNARLALRREVDWKLGPDEPAPEVVVRFTPTGPAPGVRPMAQTSPECSMGRERLTLIDRKDKVPTVIGELHTPSDTAAAEFAYGRRSDTAVAVGYSWSGKDWTTNGEYRAETSSQAAEGVSGVTSGYSRKLKSTFAYGRYRALCDRAAPYEYEVVRVIEWQPTTTVEPADNPGCPASSHPRASSYPRRGFFVREEKRAFTWENGVRVFGLGLSARSGYSEFVRAKWQFGTERDSHLLCGNNGHIAVSERIFAGPKPPGCGTGKQPSPCSIDPSGS